MLIVEVVSTNFVVIFFSVAAFLVAFLKLLGLNQAAFEWVLFAAFGGLGVWGLRSFLVKKTGLNDSNPKPFSGTDTNQTLTLSCSIEPGETANIQYQGTVWSAKNSSDVKLNEGETVRIIRTEGIKLFVEK